MLTVSDIMTRAPYTLGTDDNLEDARKLMTEHHIRHIPIVTEDEQVIGIVSHRDVLASSDSALTRKGDKERYISLGAVMTSPVQTVDESASLRGTALHLQKHRLGCVPVIRDSQLVGIITDSDFVAIAINLMEQLDNLEPEEADFEDSDL